jgi:hypothetical protein
MENKDRMQQNQGAQQGNIDRSRDEGKDADRNWQGKETKQTSGGREAMEDDIRPADARDTRDETTGIGVRNDINSGSTSASAFDEPRKPQEDSGQVSHPREKSRHGNMEEQFKSKEGFRTMDEDDNVEDPMKKGDNETLGNP